MKTVIVSLKTKLFTGDFIPKGAYKMKKQYVKPAMEVVEYDMQAALLAGSGDNPYWKEPDEPEEGCQSNWWCGK